MATTKSSSRIARGVRAFHTMMTELQSVEEINAQGRVDADRCQLEEQYREGAIFRNIVAEYLARLEAEPDAVAAFLACVSDVLSIDMQGVATRDPAFFKPRPALIECVRRACAGEPAPPAVAEFAEMELDRVRAH